MIEFDNSFYKSKQFYRKKIMIIVPHEDDEINLCAEMMEILRQNQCEIYCVFTTNGDYFYDGLGEVRICEAIESLKVWGIPEDHVVFLGYGDHWQSAYKHIYHAPDELILKSNIGRTETYGTIKHPEFSMLVDGCHHSYTRKNFLKDIKNAILRYLPDIIFAIDFDYHPDHRATSLLFDEAMGQILRQTEYRPQVFKGFAYNMAWEAERDFFSLNFLSTKRPDKSKLNNALYDTDVPAYKWDNRVRFPIPKSMFVSRIEKHKSYLAFQKYQSQNAILHAARVINSDKVFWERRTDNLAFKSKVTVSSGEAKYLSDFKLIDCADISYEWDKPSQAEFSVFLWIPELSDEKKEIVYYFESPQTVSEIVLYENPSFENHIELMELCINDDEKTEIRQIDNTGGPSVISFHTRNDVYKLSLRIAKSFGEDAGLAEVEILGKQRKPYIIKSLVNDHMVYRYYAYKEKEIYVDIYMYPYDEKTAECLEGYLIDAKKSYVEKISNTKYKIVCHEKNINFYIGTGEDLFDMIEICRIGIIKKTWLMLLKLPEELRWFWWRVRHKIKRMFTC